MPARRSFPVRLAVALTVAAAPAAAPGAMDPAVESFEAGPLRLLLQRDPPRLAWHLRGSLLVAERPHRELGSPAVLVEAGWRRARRLREVRPLEASGGRRGIALDLEAEGGIPIALRIEWGSGPGIRIVLSGPPEARAVREDLLRYHGERLLGVEGVRWDDPGAFADPARDPAAAAARLAGGASRFYLSSRGYGLSARPAGAAEGAAATFTAPDPDALRIEVRAPRLEILLVPGHEPKRILEAFGRPPLPRPSAPLELTFPGSLEGLREAAAAAQALVVLGVPPGGFRFHFDRTGGREAGPEGAGDGGGRREFEEVLVSLAGLLPAEIHEPRVPPTPEEVGAAFRPLFLAEPYDPSAWEHPEVWLLGEDLLVAPPFGPDSGERRIPLPAGEWESSPAPGTVEAHRGPGEAAIRSPGMGRPILLRRR